MRRLPKIAAMIASLLVGQAAAAQDELLTPGASVQPAAATEIGAAVSSCLEAVAADGVDEARLAADGWQAAKAAIGDRPLSSDSLGFYGRSGGKVLLMATRGKAKHPTCVALARVERKEIFSVVAAHISSDLQLKPFKESAGQSMWLHSNRAVELAARGDGAAPSVRVAVVYVSGEKK